MPLSASKTCAASETLVPVDMSLSDQASLPLCLFICGAAQMFTTKLLGLCSVPHVRFTVGRFVIVRTPLRQIKLTHCKIHSTESWGTYSEV